MNFGPSGTLIFAMETFAGDLFKSIGKYFLRYSCHEPPLQSVQPEDMEFLTESKVIHANILTSW